MDGSDNNQASGTTVPPQPIDQGPPVSEKLGEDAAMRDRVAAQEEARLPGGSLPQPNLTAPLSPSPLAPPISPDPSSLPTDSGLPAATPPDPATKPTGPIPIPVSEAPPSAADDSDLIEKEWVNKAKYIVESTKNDPHLLNKEMNKFKADYIQKRYHKQLKVSDD